MAFPKRSFPKKRAEPKAPLPPVAPVGDMPRLRVGGKRLDALDCALIQVVCKCGHTGEIPVAPLLERYGRATRVREALGSIRCSRCQKQDIRRIYAFR